MSKRKGRVRPPGGFEPRETLAGHAGKDRRLTPIRCQYCGKMKSLQKFFEGQPSYDPRDLPGMCNDCGRRGRALPDTVNKCDTLTVSHRKALRVLLHPTDNSVKEACAASGLTPSKVQSLLQGTLKPEFRQAFQLELAAQGLTLEQLVSNLVAATQSKKRQWNPASQEWDEFEDNSVQFQATRHAIKLMDMEPKENRGGVTVPVIVLNTNLGQATPGNDGNPPGVYTITADTVAAADKEGAA